MLQWPNSSGRQQQAIGGGEISITILAHKIKSKAKYNCIPKSLHLLSTAGSIPHVEPFPASLVVQSSTFSKFSFDTNCKF